MSQITARINLSAKTFPFVSANWGRTVLVAQYDTNFNRQVQSTEDNDHDVGIPQVFYCHNVMPHAQGFQSIGYDTVVSATAGEVFENIYDLNDASGNSAYFAVTASGHLYVQEPGKVWTQVGTTTDLVHPFYLAYCSGVTYIWQQTQGYYTYSWSTHTLSGLQSFAALNTQKVVGLTSSFGYLIAWTNPNPAGTFPGTVNTGDTFVTSTFSGPVPKPGDLIGSSISSAELPPNTIITAVTWPQLTISNPAIGTNAAAVFTLGATPGGVFWSSTIDPTDFTPSLVTGAGGGQVEQVVGAITICAPHTQGFFVYSEENCVVALYTQNSRYPFSFKAIIGSGGVKDPDLITFDANTNLHYAYTTSGMQLIGVNSAQTVFPELTDFISGQVFEDFDDTLLTFSLTQLTAPLQKHVEIISSRYLVISYGVNSYTHALVYDIVSQRIGKLKIPHVDCFELDADTLGVVEIARQNIAFLQADGTIKVVDFDEYKIGSQGTLILGKYQFVRARNLILDTVIIEKIPNPYNFTLTILTALTGKSTVVVNPYRSAIDDTQVTFNSRTEGVNHSLLLQGQFHIESGVLVFHLGGKR